ncbi:putative baseplate assembly protein [Dyella jiangningensis]|uniref:Putative baseplate assembly protein n=1 Tax=Dyella jiangningensis TaxID=1379159 RepID=A0A328P7P3_9GAMM|nr:putative baseplate assembly protein [Dyella jiangningensis]RAO78109.1 putative baseplate assembly protein [Dyella jiangningensis]
MSTMDNTPAAIGISCQLLPACSDDLRREKVRLEGKLNGIDFVEVGDDGVTLCVHLFGGVPSDIAVANVRISGGDRITGLRVLSVSEENEPDMHDDVCLRVVLDREGDHSAYCLCLVDASSGDDPANWRAYPGFDPRYACAPLRFRLGCAKDLDCAAATACVKPAPSLPDINYLAKDYASFRQLFFDRMAITVPGWQERHVPDIGVALVEVMAYVADHLSYYQDAVATEAYLATARRRISVRRHARLVDYRMHEGCNARAFVTLALAAGEQTLALDQLLLLVPPPGQLPVAPGPIDAKALDAARAQGALVFEPMTLDGADTITVVAAQSAIRIYTWGNQRCCLPRGSTQAVLLDAPLPAPPTETPPPGTPPGSDGGGTPLPQVRSEEVNAPRRALKLKPGDFLIFEEVLGVSTGNPADADPSHRHAVRLTGVQERVDPLDGSLLLQVNWDACDALPFDLCLSVRLSSPDCRWIDDVSLARGNVLLVDHGDHPPGQCQCDALCVPPEAIDDADYPGLSSAMASVPDACMRCQSLKEECWLVPGNAQYECCVCDGAVQDVIRPAGDSGHALNGSPLTWAEPLPTASGVPVCLLLSRDPRQAQPQLRVCGGRLDEVLISGIPDAGYQWAARHDLLESGPNDRHFVVEVDDDGVAHLRFGDGTLGRQPQAGDFFRALPRIGNGSVGNVGCDSIVWLAVKAGAAPEGIVPRNPMAASGGTDPESLAEVKRYAPGAFRANALRAITADDYAMFAAREPALQGASCQLAWTGGWYEADVVVDPRGAESLAPALAAKVKRDLWPYRRIGHDLAVLAARYVPLLIELRVCVLPDFLVAHVKADLLDRFTAGLRSDGVPGFFHPDCLLLGSPVYASALIAEAQAVAGVAHVELITLAREEGGVSGDVPADGVLHLASMEIAQIDSSPDHPDRGSITFIMGGGR